MSLPRITHYELPTEEDLPPARVDWTLRADAAALLIHDMQTYFVRAFASDDFVRRLTANIAAIRSHCDEVGIPVYYTVQTGGRNPRDRGLQADFWGPGMRRDPRDQAIVEALAPRPGDTVLGKWRYSAFQRSPFESTLQARGRSQLIVTGVYAHIGCLLTAAEAFMRDIQPFFIADAVGDFSREKHDLAIEHISGCCGAVTTTARVVGRKP